MNPEIFSQGFSGQSAQILTPFSLAQSLITQEAHQGVNRLPLQPSQTSFAPVASSTSGVPAFVI
jgi:hypothetical protein